ncbi:hypothetical protein [Roseovarius aestuariivivens]|nr:hypothetical protein [Roseovarius aestuariivivens]
MLLITLATTPVAAQDRIDPASITIDPHITKVFTADADRIKPITSAR